MHIENYQDLPSEKFLAIKEVLDKSPMLKFIGAEGELLAPGFARVRIPFRREFLQGFGVVQGGIIATAADTAAGVAFLTLLEPNEAVVTIDIKINFLTSIKDSDIISECRIIQKGALISLGEFEIKTPEGALAAKGLTTLTTRVIK